jgi:hypothetical protein
MRGRSLTAALPAIVRPVDADEDSAGMEGEARAERRAREQELTERAVAQLRCSEGWQRWLAVRARVGLHR